MDADEPAEAHLELGAEGHPLGLAVEVYVSEVDIKRERSRVQPILPILGPGWRRRGRREQHHRRDFESDRFSGHYRTLRPLRSVQNIIPYGRGVRCVGRSGRARYQLSGRVPTTVMLRTAAPAGR